MLKSVDFGRFMTPEGSEMLLLALTSKTGQYLAHNRHIILSFYYIQSSEIQENIVDI